ncbi:MAG: hypothetical protein HKN25_05720 [Pyrinomonadaceae bacterium]|nr:hypothetical protein [Pyrinomonadaceae bacterium]
MKSGDYKKLIRKSHRYLGVFIGIQFLLWTISGIFFSWTNIKEIRGDHLRGDRNAIRPLEGSIAPADIKRQLAESNPDSSVTSLRIVSVMDANYFEVIYSDAGKKEFTALFDTKTGEKRNSITREEAEEIAAKALKEKAEVKQTDYLTAGDVSSHHEYREKPLPAWAVSFDHPEALTVYLSADNGQIQSFRTSNWRVFDFLWMLHTMDFIARDDINNWTLRIFSALSLLMILSGFVYFFITFRKPW